MMCLHANLPIRYKGSAMVEFALVLTVLLPVGFGVAMIGKLSDLALVSEQAGRYTAWEATVYSRDALSSQASAVEARFFNEPDALIISEPDRKGGADKQREGNPIWGRSTANPGDFRQLGSVSRDTQQIVTPSYEFDTGKASAASTTGEIAAKAGRALAGFKGNSWGIVGDGLLRSGVEVAVKPTGLLRAARDSCGASDNSVNRSAPSGTPADNAKHVCVRASGVILADGWSASGDEQAVSRVRSLVPASTLGYVGEGLSRLLGSVLFPELDPLDKAFGHVDMGVLPEYAEP